MHWRPRSLRIRYTLRALLVFITLFCLWCGYHANRGWREREAERILRAHGGSLGHREGHSPSSIVEHATSAYQSLVERLWGDHGFTEAVVGSQLDGEVVDAICALPQLHSLHIIHAHRREEYERYMASPVPRPRGKIPTGAVRTICSKQPLKWLDIRRCNLDESDFLAIAEQPSIEVLGLGDTNLSDSALAKVVELPRLRSLGIVQTEVSGSDLDEKRGSKSLERIKCGGAPVGIRFARFIANCPRLMELQALHPAIDDAFVAELRGHPSLTNLSMPGTSITDSCIDHLLTMPRLEVAAITPSLVTEKGIDRLLETNTRGFPKRD